MELNNKTAIGVKNDFPIFKTKAHGKSLVYLDSTATTQRPKSVIESVSKFYKEENASIHRGVYQISEKATEHYQEAHKIVAEFINADSEEVIFTRNTTDSLNLLARSLENYADFENRDEIVLTEMEHHSNLIPWQQLAKRKNLKLKFIKMKDDFTLDYEDAKEKITEKTAILSFVYISNSLGTINDAKKLIEIGKEKGALTIIDGAQAVPHIEIDVKNLNCDFLCFSAHKMFGPMGIGAVYGKKEHLLKMDPYLFGGDMIKDVTYEDAKWDDLPMKFEAGTQNVSGAVGFMEAIKFIQQIGIENIEKWDKELLRYALEKIGSIEGVKLYNAGIENSVGLVSFTYGDIHPHDVAGILDFEGICIRAGHHCTMPLMKKLGITGTCRASFSVYTTFEDIDKLCDGLMKVKEVFK